MNIDTDMQWAYWEGVKNYSQENSGYLQAQIGNPEGGEKPKAPVKPVYINQCGFLSDADALDHFLAVLLRLGTARKGTEKKTERHSSQASSCANRALSGGGAVCWRSPLGSLPSRLLAHPRGPTSLTEAAQR